MVELLVTVSLMALVGGAAVAALSGGIRVWQRAAGYGAQQQSSLITLERFRRDLQNVRQFHPVLFTGTYEQCSFAAVARAMPASDAPEEVGRLGYYLDERRHQLCRSFVPYRLMKRYRLTERCDPLLGGVMRLRFSYYGAEEAGHAPEWRERWEAAASPVAMKADLLVQADPRRTVPLAFTVVLAGSASPTGAAAGAGK